MRSSFTLIEMSIVVAIMMIVMTVSFPNLRRLYQDTQLSKLEKEMTSFIESQRLISKDMDTVCVISINDIKQHMSSNCDEEITVMTWSESLNVKMNYDSLFINPDGQILNDSNESVSTIQISLNDNILTLGNGGSYGSFKRI